MFVVFALVSIATAGMAGKASAQCTVMAGTRCLDGKPGVTPSAPALEEMLRGAMTYDAAKDARTIESGVAVRAFARAGLVPLKPNRRLDYTDYRAFRKPASLFGQELVVLEEEYPSRYIGCCVSPGIGAIVKVGAGFDQLERFAAASRCKISRDKDILDTLRMLGLATGSAAYASISCRERDAAP